MAAFKIRVKGMEKLQHAFRIAPRATTEGIDLGIRGSIFKLEGTAKRESPVDTGRLRASHQSRFAPLKGELYPAVDYGVFVHEPGVRRKWKGDPWLKRSADKDKVAVERIMETAVNKVIKNVFK